MSEETPKPTGSLFAPPPAGSTPAAGASLFGSTTPATPPKPAPSKPAPSSPNSPIVTTRVGKVTQVIGPVVDVEFEGELPAINSAVVLTNPSIDPMDLVRWHGSDATWICDRVTCSQDYLCASTDPSDSSDSHLIHSSDPSDYLCGSFRADS